MEGRQRQPAPGPALAREAEALIRSLEGVLGARVHAGPRGINAIHVLARHGAATARVAGQVRSALLAGMATPVPTASIHVRTGAAEMATAEATATTPRPDTAPAPPPHPSLVDVRLERPGYDRLLCRVTVRVRARACTAEAVAIDLPGAPAQAAAMAAIRALGIAGVRGLHLEGLRQVEIARRDYVVVALARAGAATPARAGCAHVSETVERAAAQAVLDAARDPA